MGVWKIDHLVMSHNQGDHAGGVNAGLIFDFKIGMLYHNGTKNEILWTALENDIPFTEMKLHDELKIGAEEQLAEMYKNGELDVDLLKLANHGNPNTSNGKALWDSTTPELAVATGFYPLETGYTKAYEEWGYEGDVLFDRKHGFIHITATNDGKMERETSREDYAEPFGDHWNTEVGG